MLTNDEGTSIPWPWKIDFHFMFVEASHSVGGIRPYLLMPDLFGPRKRGHRWRWRAQGPQQ